MITLEFQHVAWLISLLMAWSALLVFIIRLLMQRVVSSLDAHLANLAADYKRLDADFKQVLIKLPIEYQRREDSIREYTTINAKLDRLYEQSRKA